MKKTRGLILGPSGVGKNFGLGQILQEYYGFGIFVSGDWCRKVHADSAEKGILIRDPEILAANAAHYHDTGCPDRFMFDCPRSLDQAKEVLKWFQAIGTDEVVVFHMHAPKPTCVERIIDRATRQGRADDADAETIERRLGVYFNPGGLYDTVGPFLRDNCNEYVHIDAHPDLEEVRMAVLHQHCPRIFPASSMKRPVLA